VKGTPLSSPERQHWSASTSTGGTGRLLVFRHSFIGWTKDILEIRREHVWSTSTSQNMGTLNPQLSMLNYGPFVDHLAVTQDEETPMHAWQGYHQ